MAEGVQNEINSLDIFRDVKVMSFEEGCEKGLISYIDESVLDAFLDEVYKERILDEPCKGLKVVYTPLNGTGLVGVTRILKRIGVEDVVVVPEQEKPDGNFTTCPFPNPEIREALELGLCPLREDGSRSASGHRPGLRPAAASRSSRRTNMS